MGTSYLLGKRGEEFACRYLQNNGFQILNKNWRFSRYGEIDLIVIDKATKDLVFVEVKTRSTGIGDAKELVTCHKQKQLFKLASSYMQIKKIKNVNCRFDVIALKISGCEISLEHVRRAFMGN